MWAAGGAVLAPVAFALARMGHRFGWWLVGGVVLALGVYPALSGHAAATGDLRWWTLSADALHVWAAGGWVGGLTFVLWMERAALRVPGAPGGPRDSLLPVLVPAFSPLALVCAAVLALTGGFAAWVHLESARMLVTTGYGRLLLGKLAVVGLVVALGAWNWRRLTPRLAEPSGPPSLRRSASVELLLMHVVLVVTALLVRTSPTDM